MVGHVHSFAFIPSLVVEDAKWSRGDSGRPARAHKVRVVFNVNDVHTDIPFTLLFFYYLRSLFHSTLKIFMALQKTLLQLYHQQS